VFFHVTFYEIDSEGVIVGNDITEIRYRQNIKVVLLSKDTVSRLFKNCAINNTAGKYKLFKCCIITF